MSDRAGLRRDQRFTLALVVVGVALAVGGVAGLLPEEILVALVATLAMFALLLLARRYVNVGPAATSTAGVETLADWSAGASMNRDQVLAPGRYLYYGGMLCLGQVTLRPLMSITASDWLFLGALVATLAGLMASRSGFTFRIPALILLGAALYVVFGMLSSVGAADPAMSMAYVGRVGYLTIAWFWLGTMLLTRGTYLRTAMALWVASIAFDGLGAMLQAKGVPIPFLGPVMSARMTGFTDHPNNLGGPAAVAMAPAFALAITSARLGERMVWILALFLIIAAAVLSGSVAGMAAGVGAIVAWLVVSSTGMRVVLLVLMAVTLAVGISQIQREMGLPTPVERVLSATGQSEGGRHSTVAIRLRGYSAAWNAVGNGGLFGYGLDRAGVDIGGARAAHNMLLKDWYEAGWPAAMGMLCMLLGGLGAALLAARLALSRLVRLLATSLFAATMAFFVFSLSSPLLSQRYGWVSVALALGALVVARADRDARTLDLCA